MKLSDTQTLALPPSADMHVHLRQDAMAELVAPQIRKGGVDTVFVMPNLVPPITTVAAALVYKSRLVQIEPNVRYLMSLYLHASITPEVIADAAAAGIAGVKLYPQGVTTNSDSGVTSLDAFFPVFAAMEKHDLVLNLHGEVADLAGHGDITHEEAFLPTLQRLHQRFPKLRIVLEHCTTAAAVEAVRACGPNVSGTITAHHLYLTTADTCDPHAFCKPIPKKAADRDALCRAVVSGDPKFFFGSDSAPHPLRSKQVGPDGKAPAGVFTQPYATQLVLLALEEAVGRRAIHEGDVTLERLELFLSRAGRRFYKLPEPAAGPGIVLRRRGEKVAQSIRSENGAIEVGVSRGGVDIWSLSWA
ncbi:hypothetical protein P8C59_004682 [Phyllachora maydis]|uniref:dihydroorotase n=1 Tax=Phyllachora maydis TaxID=1825666 RepID=A0AAD9I2T8_9PEZI|nr:hypothetical protein P8C59_004682 [Phyllachora maydis]